MVSKAIGERQQAQRRIRITDACREHRASGDIDVAESVNASVFIYHTKLRIDVHPRSSHGVVKAVEHGAERPIPVVPRSKLAESGRIDLSREDFDRPPNIASIGV